MAHLNEQGENNSEREICELNDKIRMLTIFIDNAYAGVYVTDYYTNEILFANRKVSALNGYKLSVEELIGKTCWHLINKDGNGPCPFCPRDKLLNSDGKPTKPYVWEHYFDEYGGVWLRINSEAITWVDGRLAQMTTFFDITENKRMQQQLEQLVREDESQKMQQNMQMVLDLLPIPVRIVDLESTEILYVNNALTELFGMASPQQAIGQSAFNFTPEIQPDGTSTYDLVKRTCTEKPVSEELVCIRADGQRINVLMTACAIDYNGKRASLGIMKDLTAEKEYERMLRGTAEKEREANQLKSKFLSNMSHEIRTPMNAIMGLTDLELRRGQPGSTREVFKKINTSAKNLLQIVNDILDISKIEANKMELFPCEFILEEVLSSALLVVSPRLEGKKVELILNLSINLPLFMIGDRVRLWQILKNYLDNAIKFTKTGRVELAVFEDENRTSDDTVYVTFKIADTGVGMNLDQLHRALLPYEQVHDALQIDYAGTGLGLPISKQLCDLMGGEVTIESVFGSGTTVSATLPFKRSENNETIIKGFSGISGLSSLIVGDNSITIGQIETLLFQCGAICKSTDNLAEALNLAKLSVADRKPFDIIIIDGVSKQHDLQIMAERLKQCLPKSSVLVTLASYDQLKISVDSVMTLVDGIIEKPIIPTVFLRCIMSSAGIEKAPEGVSRQSYSNFSGARVLICEDNEINREVVGGMLEQFGIFPVFAENGAHGIELIKNNELFDLIFMDLHMPVMDGFEASHIIRTERRFDSVPIISLTADAMTETIERCRALGINDYLPKPIEFDDLYEILKKWLPVGKPVQHNHKQLI